jgi:hypothetical protein
MKIGAFRIRPDHCGRIEEKKIRRFEIIHRVDFRDPRYEEEFASEIQNCSEN